jgi:hypothetical protein
MSNIIILDQFKKQLISFFDELISQFPEAPELVILRILFKDQIPIEEVMKKFVYKLVVVRELIKNRDETFFLENNTFFSFTSKENVNSLKKLWRSNKMDAEDKLTVWKWMDSFVYLADKYAKNLENAAIAASTGYV